MAVKILVPTPLRPFTGHKDTVEVDGRTVGEVLQNLAGSYSGLKKHLFTDDGKLRSFVNVYVNDEDIRYMKKEETRLKGDETLSIVPSIAGGTIAEEFLSKDESIRYSRHLMIPEVGTEGQLKLKGARVLCVGMGGLGAPIGMYLAAAGVGTIGLVDFDVVDFTNLQRQITYSTQDVGKSKLQIAKERLSGINPDVNIRLHETKLTSENALQLFKGYDVIVDGTDNFPTRYLVNDACVLSGRPNVYGSIFRFEGQVTVFDAKKGPCYRCLYPEPPPPGLVPSCAEGGVLGVLPGIIGTLQALETIKLFLGKGEPLIGRLVLFDALRMSFRELKLRKDPSCPVCGEKPTVTRLIDYERFCGIKREAEQVMSEYEIELEEFKNLQDQEADIFLLDVREPWEWDICHFPEARLIPLGELPKRLNELDSSKETIVHCKSGGRSAKAVDLLKKAGFKKVKNLKGGINGWSDRIDPSVPKY